MNNRIFLKFEIIENKNSKSQAITRLKFGIINLSFLENYSFVSSFFAAAG